jgi:DNA-binding response OmpR family regulator
MVKQRVLVVDDDPTVADVVMRYLALEGFDVDVVHDGHSALARAFETMPSLVVLDLMLPGMDGLEVCRRLRETGPVPVVMLTARGDEEDRITGLELGADDYVAKPFSPRELTARVKAVLRRAEAPLAAKPAIVVRFGDVELDVAAREVVVGGSPTLLTAREFDLLSYMALRPRRAFRREELLEDVWGFEYGDTATVTVHIRRLREKIEKDPSNPRWVKTVWGVGYRFDPE